MSILIKGAKMPTGCRMCHFKEWTNSRAGWFCPLRHKFLSKRMIIHDKRYADCPLIAVPSHGRLIDADALTKRATTVGETDDLWDYYSQTTQDFVDYINDAPTVIESEVENHE